MFTHEIIRLIIFIFSLSTLSDKIYLSHKNKLDKRQKNLNVLHDI